MLGNYEQLVTNENTSVGKEMEDTKKPNWGFRTVKHINQKFFNSVDELNSRMERTRGRTHGLKAGTIGITESKQPKENNTEKL